MVVVYAGRRAPARLEQVGWQHEAKRGAGQVRRGVNWCQSTLHVVGMLFRHGAARVALGSRNRTIVASRGAEYRGSLIAFGKARGVEALCLGQACDSDEIASLHRSPPFASAHKVRQKRPALLNSTQHWRTSERREKAPAQASPAYLGFVAETNRPKPRWVSSDGRSIDDGGRSDPRGGPSGCPAAIPIGPGDPPDLHQGSTLRNMDDGSKGGIEPRTEG